jgi:hypothetical protein
LHPCTKVQYLRPLENQQRIWYNFLRQKLYKPIETQPENCKSIQLLIIRRDTKE